MKLLFCPHCGDVRKLDLTVTTCWCGLAKGRYLEDRWSAEVNREARLIGLDNNELNRVLSARHRFERELETRPNDRHGYTPNPRLEAWLMTDNPRVTVVDEIP